MVANTYMTKLKFESRQNMVGSETFGFEFLKLVQETGTFKTDMLVFVKYL